MLLNSARRMILTVGDARIGKSTITKLLIEIYQLQSKRIKVYDHDNRDKLQAYKHLVEIEKIDFFNRQTDKILNDITNDELDIIFVDMPGQYVDKICQYIVQSYLLETLCEYSWKLTFIQPISHRQDCIDYLKQLIETVNNNANYVIVKNQHFSPYFQGYEEEMQNKIVMIGGTEIELTDLHRNHYQAMEKSGIPYWDSCYELSIILFWRMYIFHWIKKFRASVMDNSLAMKYLGLD